MQNGVQQMRREDEAEREEGRAVGGAPTLEGMRQLHAEIVTAYKQLDDKFHDRCIAELQTKLTNCHSLQRINTHLAVEWERRLAEDPSSAVAGALARAYRDAADELERALR